MPRPSELAIHTAALTRLVKEESSYRKELAEQEARLKNLESGGGATAEAEEEGNREFALRQEVSNGPLFCSCAISVVCFSVMREECIQL